MIAYLLENLSKSQWWPLPAWPNSGPDSLWLPCHSEDESTTLAAIREASKQLKWVAMATLHRRRGASWTDFSARFPGLAQGMLDTVEVESPNGLVAVTVWCEIDPTSEHLGELISMSRRARGKGVCIALKHDSVPVSNWLSSSIGMMWRAPLAVSPHKSRNYALLDGLIVSASLMAMIETGFVQVVPLDLHPSAGFVLLGRSGGLNLIAEALMPNGVISSTSDVIEGLFAGGGGVAL